jgi:hypothetical protein
MTTTPDSGPRRLTFRSGGWVLLLAALISIALIAWALGPALVGWAKRPPGDGRTIESYAFDLDHLQVPRDLLFPAMPHRDLVRTLDEPSVLPGEAVTDLNRRRGKYLLPTDRVIGVTVAGVSRAYPISVMTVHEIVNDVLAETPIAVTYNWPCDSVMVFDRRLGDRTAAFGVSGLLYNSNMLMYERSDAAEPGGESLWSQLGARAVSGPAALDGDRLTELPYVVTSWGEWLLRHPDTTVIDRDPGLIKKRYSKSTPTEYFLQGRVIYPVRPLPPEGGLQPLSRVLALELDGDRRVYPLIEIRERSEAGETVTDTIGGVPVTFEFDAASGTALVLAPADAPMPAVRHAAWFAWHAFHPDDALATW